MELFTFRFDFRLVCVRFFVCVYNLRCFVCLLHCSPGGSGYKNGGGNRISLFLPFLSFVCRGREPCVLTVIVRLVYRCFSHSLRGHDGLWRTTLILHGIGVGPVPSQRLPDSLETYLPSTERYGTKWWWCWPWPAGRHLHSFLCLRRQEWDTPFVSLISTWACTTIPSSAGLSTISSLPSRPSCRGRRATTRGTRTVAP